VTGHNELRVSDRSQRTGFQWQVTTNCVSVTGHDEFRVSGRSQRTACQWQVTRTVSDRSQRNGFQWQVTTNWVLARSYKKLISALLERTKPQQNWFLFQSVLTLKTQCHSGHPISMHFASCQPRTLVTAGITFLGCLCGRILALKEWSPSVCYGVPLGE